MVRKVIVVFLSCILIATAFSGAIYAESRAAGPDDDPGGSIVTDYYPYNSNISSNVLTIFEKILYKQGIFDDYVIFRSGEYSYTLFIGDIFDQGSQMILKENGTLYEIFIQSNYSQDYTFSVGINSTDYILHVNNYLVYSNIGDFPTVISNEVNYIFILLVVVIIIGFCALMRSLFSFTYRFRNGKGG